MHHRPPAAPLHQRHATPRGESKRLQIDRQHPVPDRHVDIGDRPVLVEPEHSGGIHQIIDAAERFRGTGHRALDETLIRQISLEIEMSSRTGGDPRRLRFQIRHRHVTTGLDQTVGDCQPHAAAGARDEGRLVLETHATALILMRIRRRVSSIE